MSACEVILSHITYLIAPLIINGIFTHKEKHDIKRATASIWYLHRTLLHVKQLIVMINQTERRREIECVSDRARRTCCVTYAALQTSQIILSCICIMCIGMATHLDRKSTCTVIETNMVILLGAYLAYFSLTNQSREVTCDFGFASGVVAGCDG